MSFNPGQANLPIVLLQLSLLLLLPSLVSWWLKQMLKQDAPLSQRDRAAGCVIVFAKSGRMEPGENILRTL